MGKTPEALKGTLAEALDLQRQNRVPQNYCGFWFHSSKYKRTRLVEHSEPTFFSRSPLGWTGWGGARANDPILVGVVSEPLSSDSVLRAPFVSGADKDGFDSGEPLLDRWLVLVDSAIDRLMIVDQYVQSETDNIKAYADAPEYVEFRKRAIERTAEAQANRQAGLEQARAAPQKDERQAT